MKIAFCDNGILDYTPDTPLERPLGGTESAAAYLSAAMAARGHDVALINRSSRIGKIRDVTVTGIEGARAENLQKYDVAICLTRPLGANLRKIGFANCLVSWQHMVADAERVRAFAEPNERQAWNGFAFVSDYQREEFFRVFGIEGVTLRNAASPAALSVQISPMTFLDRGDDPILIYTSAPGRGLDMLLAAFAAARERLPNLRLKICSDEGIYHRDREADRYGAFYALARALQGVEFTGSVGQRELAEHLSGADVFAYPTEFRETSCIAAIEAAVCGCTIVTTDYGALRETMNGFGSFMPPVNSRSQTAGKFAELIWTVTANARADPDLFRRRRADQVAAFRASHTWASRAEEWEQWLGTLL